MGPGFLALAVWTSCHQCSLQVYEGPIVETIERRVPELIPVIGSRARR